MVRKLCLFRRLGGKVYGKKGQKVYEIIFYGPRRLCQKFTGALFPVDFASKWEKCLP